MIDVEKDDLCKGARLVSYAWIVEDIRRIRAKQWKTKDDELYLKELYELRKALLDEVFITIEQARAKRNYDKFNT